MTFFRFVGEGWHSACADHEGAVRDLVLVLEEAALGRAGGAGTVGVVGAAVAGAQEEFGLREPADGAAEVSAVDGEDLEGVAGDAADPAGNVAGLAVPCGRDGIAVVDEPRLAFGKVGEWAEVDPGVIGGGLLQCRAEEVADDRHGENGADRSVDQERELEEEGAARVACGDARVFYRLCSGLGRWCDRFVGAAHSVSWLAAPAVHVMSSLLVFMVGRSDTAGPDSAMRFEASQATMSVICWSVRGCAASERQSGIPSSGRPAMVMLRRS